MGSNWVIPPGLRAGLDRHPGGDLGPHDVTCSCGIGLSLSRVPVSAFCRAGEPDCRGFPSISRPPRLDFFPGGRPRPHHLFFLDFPLGPFSDSVKFQIPPMPAKRGQRAGPKAKPKAKAKAAPKAKAKASAASKAKAKAAPKSSGAAAQSKSRDTPTRATPARSPRGGSKRRDEIFADDYLTNAKVLSSATTLTKRLQAVHEVLAATPQEENVAEEFEGIASALGGVS
jgi:hypothetical protein